jgi:hypothetical protein
MLPMFSIRQPIGGAIFNAWKMIRDHFQGKRFKWWMFAIEIP